MTHFLQQARERVKNTYCMGKRPFLFLSRHSVAFGVILSLLFVFVFFFVCTVEDISTQDGAIGVKFWLRVEQTS